MEEGGERRIRREDEGRGEGRRGLGSGRRDEGEGGAREW
jgi:hypothetical protein